MDQKSGIVRSVGMDAAPNANSGFELVVDRIAENDAGCKASAVTMQQCGGDPSTGYKHHLIAK